jgi:hypothetical protein
LTDADSILPGINGGISQIQNPDNLTNEKALSSQDVPYMFTAAFLYELPFGRGKHMLSHGIGAAVLGGWQIGGVLRYQTGVPISFGCANGINGWQNCIRFNRASAPPLNPDVHNGKFDRRCASSGLLQRRLQHYPKTFTCMSEQACSSKPSC